MVERIVSGGQTGVDRAALDFALANEIPHGGWCPRGRRAEDGIIPSVYQLTETESRDYQVRTRQNVIDSDATLILFRGRLGGGTALTLNLAKQHKKPVLAVDMEQILDISWIYDWLQDLQLDALNIAGPRESNSPGIARAAQKILQKIWDCKSS